MIREHYCFMSRPQCFQKSALFPRISFDGSFHTKLKNTLKRSYSDYNGFFACQKSDPVPFTWDSQPVKVLTNGNIDAVISTPGKHVIIHYCSSGYEIAFVQNSRSEHLVFFFQSICKVTKCPIQEPRPTFQKVAGKTLRNLLLI